MKPGTIAVMLLFAIVSCKKADASETSTSVPQTMSFDKEKWHVRNGGDFAYRDAMLHDVVHNLNLKGMAKDSVIALLGKPEREGDGHLFYTISRTSAMLLPLSEKTLVIKIDGNGRVEWRKIHG